MNDETRRRLLAEFRREEQIKRIKRIKANLAALTGALLALGFLLLVLVLAGCEPMVDPF